MSYTKINSTFHVCLKNQWITKSILTFVTMLMMGALTFSSQAGGSGVMLSGYDPVSYFKQSGPVRGEGIFHTHEGMKYAFSSEENAELFKTNPDKYAPQFGGHCAYGMVFGTKSTVDMKVWKIFDGKLYLLTNVGTQKMWSKKAPQYITRAEKVWDKIN